MGAARAEATGGADGCEAFDGLIAALGSPAMPAEDDARVRAHLEACARCRDLAQLFASEAEEGDAPPPAPDLVAGAILAGRYRLDRVLGSGGMGVVWAATNTVTGGEVAVKLLRGQGDRARRRLLREARAASVVRHPSVVRIHDVVELDDGAPAIVMELLSGRTLQALFDLGPVALPELCRILGQVADALAAVHAAGVVHRDLKPENVFLAAEGGAASGVKLLDFGIAKRTALRAGLTSGTLTRTGALVGTPLYMSPEQVLGDEVDARADAWALGILLYQGLSGVLPTRADNLGQVIKAIAITPIEPLERLVPDLPADVASLTGRLLAKEQEERPSLDEVRAVLAGHVAGAANAPVSLRHAAGKAGGASRSRLLGVGGAAVVCVGAAIAMGARAPSPRTAATAPADLTDPGGRPPAGTVLAGGASDQGPPRASSGTAESAPLASGAGADRGAAEASPAPGAPRSASPARGAHKPKPAPPPRAAPAASDAGTGIGVERAF